MDRRDRSKRLDPVLDARDLEAVWFARPNAFAWLAGGSNVVDRESPIGIATAGYDGESVSVITNTIEADRLRDEQLPESVGISAFPWYDGTLAEAIGDRSPQPAAADFEVPGFESIDASSLRQPLSDADVDRYRGLGIDTAAAIEAVARECRPTDTEHDVGASLRAELSRDKIEAPVVLVGGAERAPAYRHYTPTEAELGGYALLSVTAERDGLHASCTRTVAFAPPRWLGERHDAATTVEVAALDATRDVAHQEGSAGDVFVAIERAYDAVGWPDEWRNHHQGGAAGYAGREWLATPEGDEPVTTPMAYAWNPTVQGAKSEDTALVGPEGIDVLTETGDWPMRVVETPDGDFSLARHDVLRR